MKALRIVLAQTSANYKREESMDFEMTYPLPPFSTIKGAIHSACKWRTLRKMNISIQGEFKSMHNKYYTSILAYNSTFDDRGTLVKMCNTTSLSNAYTKVACSKARGCSYKHNREIHISNNVLYEEYIKLLSENTSLIDENKKLLSRRKELKKIIEEYKKKEEMQEDEKELYDSFVLDYENNKKEMKRLKKQKEEVQYSLSFFRCIEHIPRNIEILDNVYLILHIRADTEMLKEILENIPNLTCLGRSEDFVEVVNAEIVDLQQDKLNIVSEYSAYINADDIQHQYFVNADTDENLYGTKYYLNSFYEIVEEKRKFEKIKVIYTSCHKLKEYNDNIFTDTYNNETLIVNFLK